MGSALHIGGGKLKQLLGVAQHRSSGGSNNNAKDSSSNNSKDYFCASFAPFFQEYLEAAMKCVANMTAWYCEASKVLAPLRHRERRQQQQQHRDNIGEEEEEESNYNLMELTEMHAFLCQGEGCPMMCCCIICY